MSTVQEVLDGLADGSVTIEAAEADFAARDWPKSAPAPTVNGVPDERADPEPEPDGSFAAVQRAYFDGKITLDTYGRLANAAAGKQAAT